GADSRVKPGQSESGVEEAGAVTPAWGSLAPHPHPVRLSDPEGDLPRTGRPARVERPARPAGDSGRPDHAQDAAPASRLLRGCAQRVQSAELPGPQYRAERRRPSQVA